jgi:hypothetical protein
MLQIIGNMNGDLAFGINAARLKQLHLPKAATSGTASSNA